MDKIWVYALAYNESHFVPNFLKAYKKASRIIVYDNQSTDDTVKLLKKDKRVKIRTYDSNREIKDDLYLEIKNNCWKEAIGHADWVIVVDFDEIFTRADNKTFDLDLSKSSTYDLIVPQGFFAFPQSEKNTNPLRRDIRVVPDKNSEKPCCFRPDRLSEINFYMGCHQANPIGLDGTKESVKILKYSDFMLLHYKYANPEVFFNKNIEYAQRLSEYNRNAGFGIHYTWDLDKQIELYTELVKRAKPLFIT